MNQVEPDTKLAVIEHLQEFVTPKRKELMENILAQRTRALTVVIEDVYQPHNASAVLRSCECFGIHDVHIIEKDKKYRVNTGVAHGAENWLNIHRFSDKDPSVDNTVSCIQHLKDSGYRIAATALSEDAIPITDVNVDENLAICFGTEDTGLSEIAINLADFKMKIPMTGFTQSFNISVSVALSLYELSPRIRNRKKRWKLTENEKIDIRYEWLVNSVRGSKLIIEKFLRER